MVQTLPRIISGVCGLDQILGGGFIEGASYILQGQPGAGKTILANQAAFANVKTGGKVLYVTLLAETHDRLFQVLGTLDFFDRSQLGVSISYVSVFQTLRDSGLPAVVELLRKEIARQSATLLVFDGLLNARDQANSVLDVKTFVAEVQSQAAFVGCTVLFLTSTRFADDSPEHTMVDGVVELHEEVPGVRSVRRLQVKKSRGSAALGGLHQFDITSAGLTVFPRLEAVLHHPSIDDGPPSRFLKSGVNGFDNLIGGGLQEASVTLLFGPSGSGKTAFGLNFLNEVTADEQGLYFGFYETPARLRAKATSLGLDIDGHVDAGHIDIVWNPMTENLLDRLGHQLLHAVRIRRVKRLLIDGLGGFERAAVHQPRMNEFFSALINELRALGVTTIATWELHDLFGPTVTAPGSELSSLMDNLVMVRHVEKESRYRKALSILKVRDSAFDPHIRELTFGNNGIEVDVPLEPVLHAATGLAAPVSR